jgi:hypothetical protein
MSSKILWTYSSTSITSSIQLHFHEDGKITNSILPGNEPSYISTFWKIEDGYLVHKKDDQNYWARWSVPLERCDQYNGLLQAYLANELEKAMLL